MTTHIWYFAVVGHYKSQMGLIIVTHGIDHSRPWDICKYRAWSMYKELVYQSVGQHWVGLNHIAKTLYICVLFFFNKTPAAVMIKPLACWRTPTWLLFLFLFVWGVFSLCMCCCYARGIHLLIPYSLFKGYPLQGFRLCYAPPWGTYVATYREGTRRLIWGFIFHWVPWTFHSCFLTLFRGYVQKV